MFRPRTLELVHAMMYEAAQLGRATWLGHLRLGDRWATWQGSIGDGKLHRHFAAQAVFSQRPIRIFDAQNSYVEGECVLIDPLTPHRIEPGPQAQLVYLEPGTFNYAGIDELLRPARSTSSPAVVSSPQGTRFWATWLATPAAAPKPIDARITAGLEFIECNLLFGSVPLQAAAAQSALSPDRFRHLFEEQVGLPYRRYVLWRRLRMAATELTAGQNVTTAAHAAGFSDAAHFARTLKATFGVTAGQTLLAR